MTWQLAVWLIYAAMGIAFELYCVFTNNGNTISEWVWSFEGIKGHVVSHTSLRRMVLIGGGAILAAHLWTGYI